MHVHRQYFCVGFAQRLNGKGNDLRGENFRKESLTKIDETHVSFCLLEGEAERIVIHFALEGGRISQISHLLGK